MKFAAPLPPDWRWTRVQAAVRDGITPEDPFLRDVYSVVKGTYQDKEIHEALYLYHVPYERDVIIAFFLSGATLDQIRYGLGISVDVLRPFATLFIDMKTFRNKIEWRLYAKYYADNCCIPDVKKQLEVGLSHGPHILMHHWTMGSDVLEIPEREILSRWTMTAYSKAMIARDASINSAAAKEAFKWGAMAVKSVMELRNMRTEASDTNLDAVLAIKKRRDVLEPKELGISIADIAH